MSLSPFDSFQSRFVTYLLNFPRRINQIGLNGLLIKRTLRKNEIVRNEVICVTTEKSGVLL